MVVKIKYRYFGFDYLVADADGCLYLLPHFCYCRTVWFKKVKIFKNGSRKAIKYHGSNVSFKQLRERKIDVDETIEVY
jgi:hypothetical protein